MTKDELTVEQPVPQLDPGNKLRSSCQLERDHKEAIQTLISYCVRFLTRGPYFADLPKIAYIL